MRHLLSYTSKARTENISDRISMLSVGPVPCQRDVMCFLHYCTERCEMEL